jgi:hypothetical protein
MSLRVAEIHIKGFDEKRVQQGGISCTRTRKTDNAFFRRHGSVGDGHMSIEFGAAKRDLSLQPMFLNC